MRLPCRIILASLAILAASLLAAPRASFSQTSAQTLAQTSVQQAPDVAVPWGDAVHVFAGKIAAAIGAGRAISLDVADISTLSSAEADTTQRQLQTALGSAGFQNTTEPLAQVQVHVTLSEGSDGYLWVAEMHSQAGDQVAIMSVQKSNHVDSKAKPVPVLRATLLLSQANPILDFAVGPATGGDASRFLFVLEPEQVSVFTQREGGWTKVDAAPIEPRPRPRDLRGQIAASNTIPGADGLKVYLPDAFCTGSLQSKLQMECKPSAGTAWPLGGKITAAIVANRNYFAVQGGAQSGWPPSYSIASNSDEDHPLEILTAANGSARLLGGSAQDPAATFGRWGDEFSSIAGCGDSWNVIATGTGDWTKRDYLQDYEIADRQARMIGQFLEMPGPILALWPSNDGKSMRAVTHNLQTGMYEASLVSLSCGN